MNTFLAPLSLLASFILIVLGALGVREGQMDVCTELCMFGNSTAALSVGITVLGIGILNLVQALNMFGTMSSAAVMRAVARDVYSSSYNAAAYSAAKSINRGACTDCTSDSCPTNRSAAYGSLSSWASTPNSPGVDQTGKPPADKK